MKRAIRNKSSLYGYLDSTGVLEKGTSEEIASAKKEYYKVYKRNWRRQRRKTEKELTLSFNRDEMKLIHVEAKRHSLSNTRYIKRATLAYIDKIYLVPEVMQVRGIAQKLSMVYNLLQEIVDERQINAALGSILLSKITSLESDVLIQLHHPKTLEEWIREEISKNSSIKEKIIQLLGLTEQ